MAATLTKEDIDSLSVQQQKAILEALFLAIGIDRNVDEDERVAFRVEAEAIPWNLDPGTIKRFLEEARDRIAATSDQKVFLAWIDDIAEALPGVELREKVVATMARLAFVGGLEPRNERGLLNAFIMAFQLSDEVVQRLRKEFGRA